jgi:hypothetical protein
MKKIFAIAFLGTMGLVSCKKDYTCECVNNNITTVSTIKGTSKKVAAALCEGDGYESITSGSFTVDKPTNCTLKK